MQPEARLRSREQAAQAGEEDRGGGRAAGEVGGRPLRQRQRRVGAGDVDRGPAVVDAGRAPAVAPAVRRAERGGRYEERPVAGDAQRMRAVGRERIEAEDGAPGASVWTAAPRSPETSAEPRPVSARALRRGLSISVPSGRRAGGQSFRIQRLTHGAAFLPGRARPAGAIVARRSAPR